jgi:hypothetical protein
MATSVEFIRTGGGATGVWSWSLSWEEALRYAHQRATVTGFRYVVRRSHANPKRWLIMRRVPVQAVKREQGVGAR